MKMTQQMVFGLILLVVLPYHVGAMSDAIKRKYPHSILTEDYGILNEKDLRDENPALFSSKGLPGYVYWQCFLRNHISINLEDMGYTSEDIGGNENYSGLKITVSNRAGTSHEYVMRRRWPLSVYERKFNLWIKLMKGEQYVCLSGGFFNCKDKIEGDKKWQVCSWVFEKMKTKKGYDSYFKIAPLRMGHYEKTRQRP